MFYSLSKCQYSSEFCTLREEQLFRNGITYYACTDESHALPPVQSFFLNSSTFIFAYWKCILHIPQPSQHILYRINNLFLNFLLQLDLPVIIFWVNRITKNPVIQARNWKTIFFSILHCLTAHELILSFYFVSGTLALISFHFSPWKVIITGELVLLLPVWFSYKPFFIHTFVRRILLKGKPYLSLLC